MKKFSQSLIMLICSVIFYVHGNAQCDAGVGITNNNIDNNVVNEKLIIQ